MKRIFKNKIFLGIITIITLSTSSTILATSYLYKSNNVSYAKEDGNITGIDAALNELYNKTNSGSLTYVQEFPVTTTYNSQCISQTYTLNKAVQKGILIAGYSSFTSTETMTSSSGLTCSTSTGSCIALNNTAGGIYYGVYGINIFSIENVEAGTVFTLHFCQSRSISFDYIYGHVYSL